MFGLDAVRSDPDANDYDGDDDVDRNSRDNNTARTCACSPLAG